MAKTLLLSCRGGLGNRLLGLTSGMILARRNQASLFVYWPQGRGGTGCDPGYWCPFEALIKPIGFSIISAEQLRVMMRGAHNKLVSHNLLEGTTWLSSHGAVLDTGITYPEIGKELKKLVVSDAVEAACNRLRAQLGERYIACMVRTRGHWKARRWHPLERFSKLLAATFSDVYLCCDSKSCLDVLLRAGKARKVHAEKTGRINTVDELVVVMAELLIMRDAAVYYGTPYSALDVIVRVWRDYVECRYP